MPNYSRIRHGRKWARASLIGAVWSLFIVPALLGPLGIAAGMVAVAKGSRWWGTAGDPGSGGALVVSFYFAAGLAAQRVSPLSS